ncbi:MAG TPA: TolC family protein [Pyrinomonadaceae bacterium]|nr:TolC family protein [Pyrinomonadaceae bacterium]
MMCRIKNRFLVAATLLSIRVLLVSAPGAQAQVVTDQLQQPQQDDQATLARYIDPASGMTVDDAVRYALANNPELAAIRLEVIAARALVRQAGLRANPTLDARGSRQVNGPDNSVMVEGMLPLELGGRRPARIRVAERERDVRVEMLRDRERMLAGEVRAKFGEALAEALKLGFTEELLITTRRGYRLVVARVVEGRTAPLEQNMLLVEVNRLRSTRETSEGRVQVALIELRNLIGMKPEEPLRLKGEFTDLLDQPVSLSEATTRALGERPDVRAARAMERLAEAQIEQARAEGRFDAALTAGYQRMKQGFMLNGIDEMGQLRPIDMTSHSVTFGVSLSLPVRNKNQGAIEAAVANSEAAKRRREAAELTVRREVAAAFARYERAARAMEIFRVGVQGQSSANLNVIRQTYELGAKSLIDYISEQRRFIEVENEFIDAILATYQARVEIERASNAPGLVTR